MEVSMDWLKNRTVQRFAIVGFLGGLLVMLIGIWLEFNNQRLPPRWWAFLYIHRTEPLIFMLDLAPIVFGVIGGLLGLQYSLSGTIARGKKEWEATFDSFSDLIFVVDGQGKIIRCNHAVIDRLNTTYMNVIGKPITDILSSSKQDGAVGLSESAKGFSWFGRIYEVSMFPIQIGGSMPNSLFILRDITQRKQAEAKLEESETLFRGLFDLSPDAVIVLDPHDPNASWPIIDCNMAACKMNGYQREELIGQSIDILNVSSGTPDGRIAYLDRLRQAGNFKIETQHRRKNGEVFPVELSTTLIQVGGRELIIGIDRDITERKRVEAELLREKQFLEALILNSPAAIVVLDTKENIVSC